MNPNEAARIALAVVIGAGVGALAMYIFDPDSGRRRRALARDKARSLAHDAADSLQGTARDLRNRAQGLVAETRSAVSNVMPWTGPERRKRPREQPAQPAPAERTDGSAPPL